MSDTDSLVSGLPVLQRLALSYAPASASLPTLALLALDVRLAGIVRAASEPMLAQLRLAWWRELLAAHLSARPTGEPLLEILPSWEGDFDTLAGLVNGWEEMTGAVPLASSAIEGLAAARGKAFSVLALRIGTERDHAAAERLGRSWAFADIAAHLSHSEERQRAQALAQAQDWRPARLSRNMRPLAVLHGLASRATKRGEGLDRLPPSALLTALRLGTLGR